MKRHFIVAPRDRKTLCGLGRHDGTKVSDSFKAVTCRACKTAPLTFSDMNRIFGQTEARIVQRITGPLMEESRLYNELLEEQERAKA